MKVSCKYCGIVNKPHVCPHAKRKTNRTRTDNKVYESKEYRELRTEVLDDYNHMCLWTLYVEGKVIGADRTHHIVEIVQDESKAIDYYNLIPLNHSKHDEVHRLYKVNSHIKEEVQELLVDMIKSFKAGDKTLGKYRDRFKNISPPM